MAINILNNNNIKDINRPINDYPIYKLTDGINTDSLITLGLESGYYTLSGNLPNYKYFYFPLYSNAKQREFKTIKNKDNKPATYCILKFSKPKDNNIFIYNDCKYKKIKETTGIYNGNKFHYYLYRLKD